MFGNRHRTTVRPARGGRKYQYVCTTCGAKGSETDSSSRAQQLGRQHEAKAR